MFSHAILAFYFALTFALFAAAMPGGTPAPVTTTVTVTAPASEPTGGDVCSTGPVQCCQSVGQVRTRLVLSPCIRVSPSTCFFT